MKRLIKSNLWIGLVMLIVGCGDSGGSDSSGGGGSGSDSTAFEISSVSPTDTATDVNITSNVIIVFNKAVDDTTLSGNFTVTAAGSSVAGSISVNSDKTQATFDPTESLATSTKYTVTLSTSIKSGTGVSLVQKTTSFTTFASDSTAPTIIVKNASGTVLNTSGSSITPTEDLKLVFSEAMDTSTVTTSNITYSCNSASVTGTLTAATDSDGISDNEWSFDGGVSYQNSCTFSLGAGLKDANGVAMTAASYAFGSSCGPNDLFSDSSTFSACWTENDTGSWATVDINTTNSGTMTFVHSSSDSSASEFPAVWKRVVGNFAVTVYISSMTSASSLREMAALSAVDASDPASNYLDLWFGFNSLLSIRNVLYYGVNGTDSNEDVLNSSFTTMYLCLVRSSNTVTGYYSTGGTDFTAITGASRTLSTTATDIHVGALSTGNGFTFQADFIKFSEGGSSCPTAN